VKKENEELIIKLEEMNNKKISVLEKSAIYKDKKEQAQDLINKIEELKECPTCKQEVTEAHKKEVEKEEKNKIKDAEEKEEVAKQILLKIDSNIKLIKDKQSQLLKEQDEIREQILKQRLLDQKKKQEEEKQKRKETLKKYIQELTIKVKAQKEEQDNIKKQTQESLLDEELTKSLNEALKTARLETKTLEIKRAELKESIKNINNNLNKYKEEIFSKSKELNKIKNKKVLENWLSNHFINLVDTIEKHVLSSIFNEFNTHFQEWFNNLIEDESINASIDETFTPIIIQNGYETEVENLSGGEKTSVALAYRLALNQVINDYMSTIKTKGILILDEPTDGFSTHQLDKIRDVLEEVKAEQIIIVSHEPKMESFVEHIIRIRKNEHNSEVQY